VLRPRAVLDSPKGFIDRDGPRDAIYQRYGRGGSKVRLLYVLQLSARIRKRFRFYEGAERITRAVSTEVVQKEFQSGHQHGATLNRDGPVLYPTRSTGMQVVEF
jgi:hypothetical protein